MTDENQIVDTEAQEAPVDVVAADAETDKLNEERQELSTSSDVAKIFTESVLAAEHFAWEVKTMWRNAINEAGEISKVMHGFQIIMSV